MKILEYEKFELEYPDLKFYYKVENTRYVYVISIGYLKKESLKDKNICVINNIQFHIGMCIIPYLFCLNDFDKILIKPYKIDKQFINFFSDYFKMGLAEFYFVNGLNVSKEIIFESDSDNDMEIVSKEHLFEEALFFNSKGKDSVVGMSILREIKIPNVFFSWNPNNSIMKKMSILGLHNFVSASMSYKPKINNREIKYRGSKPFLGLLGFTGLLIAYLLDLKYLIVSNEYSANFENLNYKGTMINHQYSKSFKFEIIFHNYIKSKILKNAYYFSVLAPLYEIQIAKIFSNYKIFFESFISCNIGENKGVWCKKCPKCAFIFLILYPFLNEREILKIFGDDLFLDNEIRKHIKNLCYGKIKPFECVGTQEESVLALYLAMKKNPVLKKYALFSELHHRMNNMDIKKIEDKYMYQWKREHNFPSSISKKIDKYFSKFLTRD